MEKKEVSTNSFTIASWGCLIVGFGSYMIGLTNATIQFNEKGYFFVILMFGLFSAVSLQKSVRDKMEGYPSSQVYLATCWISFSISILLLGVGLFNAQLTLSEKGFYIMAYLLSLFAAIAVQKNTRDLKKVEER
ncbi:inner membrane protein YiaA [Pigmentibacter ruber]|uniref:inner membrane protein YiaA n=1 Tax=Pigmentibacter ruber TaxID=2683196 RepID=UPI00131EC250|nr:inner membrane protein YiaA [Pigmentibacter ruber]